MWRIDALQPRRRSHDRRAVVLIGTVAATSLAGWATRTKLDDPERIASTESLAAVIGDTNVDHAATAQPAGFIDRIVVLSPDSVLLEGWVVSAGANAVVIDPSTQADSAEAFLFGRSDLPQQLGGAGLDIVVKGPGVATSTICVELSRGSERLAIPGPGCE